MREDYMEVLDSTAASNPIGKYITELELPSTIIKIDTSSNESNAVITKRGSFFQQEYYK